MRLCCHDFGELEIAQSMPRRVTGQSPPNKRMEFPVPGELGLREGAPVVIHDLLAVEEMLGRGTIFRIYKSFAAQTATNSLHQLTTASL
jgi:hypothetical protein